MNFPRITAKHSNPTRTKKSPPPAKPKPTAKNSDVRIGVQVANDGYIDIGKGVFFGETSSSSNKIPSKDNSPTPPAANAQKNPEPVKKTEVTSTEHQPKKTEVTENNAANESGPYRRNFAPHYALLSTILFLTASIVEYAPLPTGVVFTGGPTTLFGGLGAAWFGVSLQSKMEDKIHALPPNSEERERAQSQYDDLKNAIAEGIGMRD